MQIGFIGLLTLLLVCLKVFGYIAWSWWLVFLPAIISAGLGLLIIGGALSIAWKVTKE